MVLLGGAVLLLLLLRWSTAAEQGILFWFPFWCFEAKSGSLARRATACAIS